MNSYRIKEIICVVVLLVFIIVLVGQNRQSNADAKDVFKSVVAAVDTDGLKVCKAEKFKEQFGFEKSDFEGVYYMASDSIMDVREILVVRCGDNAPADALLDKVQSRADDKYGLFKQYDPTASALLEKYVAEKKGGFVFFAVCDDVAAAKRAFHKAL